MCQGDIVLPQKPGGRTFSLKEVAKHKSLHDGWIVVNHKVYNISRFVETHPGWNNSSQVSTILAIRHALGTDCTKDFMYIHSKLAKNQLLDFYIGDLGPEEADTSEPFPTPPHPEWLPPQTDFWTETDYAKTPDQILDEIEARERVSKQKRLEQEQKGAQDAMEFYRQQRERASRRLRQDATSPAPEEERQLEGLRPEQAMRAHVKASKLGEGKAQGGPGRLVAGAIKVAVGVAAARALLRNR